GGRPGRRVRGGTPVRQCPSSSAAASCGSSSLVKKGICPSVLDCKRWISLTLSCRVRLPATQAGTTLVMGANALHTHVVWSKNSCSLARGVFQEPAESLTTLD